MTEVEKALEELHEALEELGRCDRRIQEIWDRLKALEREYKVEAAR